MRHRSARTVMWAVLLLGWTVSASPTLAQQTQTGSIVYTKPNIWSSIGGQDLWLINPDGSGNRPLIQTNPQSWFLSAHSPVWSRDGRLIAFAGVLSGAAGYVIVIFDPTLGQARVLSPLAAPLGSIAADEGTRLAFSPEGKRLAYTDWGPSHTNFYITDGTRKTSLGWRVNQGEPLAIGIDWSPREDLLVVPLTSLDSLFGRYGCGLDLVFALNQSRTALFLVQPSANAVDYAQRDYSKQLTHPCHPDPTVQVFDLQPAFSPDGKRVAFVRLMSSIVTGGPVQSSIRVINLADRTERKVITLSGYHVNRLSWSGDGTKLVFDPSPATFSVGGLSISGAGIFTTGGEGLWTINLDGTGLRRIKAPPASSPSWRWR